MHFFQIDQSSSSKWLLALNVPKNCDWTLSILQKFQIQLSVSLKRAVFGRESHDLWWNVTKRSPINTDTIALYSLLNFEKKDVTSMLLAHAAHIPRSTLITLKVNVCICWNINAKTFVVIFSANPYEQRIGHWRNNVWDFISLFFFLLNLLLSV